MKPGKKGPSSRVASLSSGGSSLYVSTKLLKTIRHDNSAKCWLGVQATSLLVYTGVADLVTQSQCRAKVLQHHCFRELGASQGLLNGGLLSRCCGSKANVTFQSPFSSPQDVCTDHFRMWFPMLPYSHPCNDSCSENIPAVFHARMSKRWVDRRCI